MRVSTLTERVNALDWPALGAALDRRGNVVVERVLGGEQCLQISALYTGDAGFRSRVVMEKHGFGRGEYRYFSYPLPPLVSELRAAFYPRAALIANRWNERMGLPTRFPALHTDFLSRCHEAGQTRPTPLLLRYGPGDYNCLHQDLYGEHVFPLQLAILLSSPGEDFSGGEFVLTEQRPRRQSRVEVCPLQQGDAVLFAVHHRPAPGVHGDYRVTMRHGVSEVRTGLRHTLGVIFHDAL
ncbi:MAG TPA: 2OG-Fe(II) oxygenase [Steroidobacteraceae bacterium]|nr:2OG-Fe(II) oxygenase [Steroidobacteraceae bacterium]